jgi:hypothetical protein
VARSTYPWPIAEFTQSSVAKYMIRRPASPSQRWLTFLRNRSTQIVAMDLLMVPSVTFELPYVFIIVRPPRRDLQRNISSDRRVDRTSGHQDISLE